MRGLVTRTVFREWTELGRPCTGLNKGKRPVAIDLKRPEGRELVQALVSAPDRTDSEGGVLLTDIGTPWLRLDHCMLVEPEPLRPAVEQTNAMICNTARWSWRWIARNRPWPATAAFLLESVALRQRAAGCLPKPRP